MSQTTGGMSFVNVRAEMSTDSFASDIYDISGHMATIELGGGERELGTQHTADGDYPIVGIGKMGLIELTIKSVYTEAADEVFERIMNAYENNLKISVRWAPKGFASGNRVFTSDPGYITSPPYPSGDSGSGEIAMNEWMLKTGRIVPSVWP